MFFSAWYHEGTVLGDIINDEHLKGNDSDTESTQMNI